jgi:hypothetical protein
MKSWILLLGTCLACNGCQSSWRIEGRVVTSTAPTVSGVASPGTTVILTCPGWRAQRSGKQAISDAAGRFAFSGGVGSSVDLACTLEAFKDGYESRRVSIHDVCRVVEDRPALSEGAHCLAAEVALILEPLGGTRPSTIDTKP